MDKVYQVFVSSTFSDLKDERRQVSQTLAKAGYIPSGMELFPATDMEQLEYIKRIIDRSDYYVLIVGGKYGSLADDSVSFTEKEYDYAASKKIPVLAFLHKEPAKIESGKTDQDESKAKKLESFRDKLKNSGRIVDFWTDKNDLCTMVVIAVGNQANLTPGVGWVRGDLAIDPKLLQDFQRLRGENEELKRLTSFRPEIRIKHLRLARDIWQEEPIIVDLWCVNTGSSDAFLGEVGIRYHVVRNDHVLPFEARIEAIHNFNGQRLLVGRNLEIPNINVGKVLDATENNAIQQGRAKLYCVGWLSYLDSADRMRITGFCRVLEFPANTTARIDNSRFRTHRDPDYEYQD